MGAITSPTGTRTAMSFSGLDSLAGSTATYAAATAVNIDSSDALDVLIQLTVTPGTTTGNKQAKAFVKVTMDSSDANWTSGPTSGTTYTDEPNLYYLGSLPLASAATQQSRIWSLVDAIGFVPTRFQLVVLNDSGVAFAASGNSAAYSVVTGNAA